MSTRFYPRFVQGNPQLRIFLPDWKMILVKPKKPLPSNVVTFKVDPRMTDWDIRNYLEKIYKVSVAAVNSSILHGQLFRTSVGMAKKDDYKIAHVSLADGQKFEWPSGLTDDTKQKEKLKDAERVEEELNKERRLDPHVQDVPSWFI